MSSKVNGHRAEEDDNEKEEEEEEEEEEEDDDEEEEEEEEEPKLKYQRLGSSVSEILKRDFAKCMAVHERFLALGTQFGTIYILDFNGNEIKRFTAHQGNINEMSIDSTGEFIASCSDDGKVSINGLYTTENMEFSYSRPITSISLDPEFSRRSTKQFCVGGKAGQLILNKKGWFGRADSVLHSGEGPIHAIKWRGSLIAWANDIGVKIFDTTTNQRITYIDRPKGSPRPDQFRCHLCWESDTILLIGWADSVKIGQVKERSDGSSMPGLPTKYVEIIALFQTDYFISGIAPFGEYLVLLAYVQEDQGDKKEPIVQRPELRIVTRNNEDVSSDALSIHGFDSYKPQDYRLDHLASESLFYIVSPKDIVVAKPRDLDDHIGWLMEREKYEEALKDAEENEATLIATGNAHRLEEIGEKYLTHLLQEKKVVEAAAQCPKVLKRDPKLWEKWIFKFASRNELKAISPYIPIGNPQLSDTVYEIVLNHFLNNDHEVFLRTITEWPSTLYNIQNIITAVKEKLKKSSDDFIMDALARLYTYDKQYDNTLDIYLRLKRGNAFELIKNYKLFDSVQDKVLLLMQFNEEEAVKLLVNNVDKIPMAQVVSQLQPHPRLLHAYLHALFIKDAHIGVDFHELQVSLYADYDRKLLLPFLRQSIHYPLEKAYAICEKRQLYPEMVFLLGRMGNASQALTLIIDKLGDVKEAIEFVEQQKDEELWESLISQSMTKPAFVSELLEYIGAHVDPIKLIKRIPEGMEITGLRDRLVKIISDYNLQMSLREGCKEILKADCVHLAERLYNGLRGGVKVDDARCPSCTSGIVCSKPESSIVVFFCSHVYHHKCLKSVSQTQNDAQPTPTPQNQAKPNTPNNNNNNNNNNPPNTAAASQVGIKVGPQGNVSGVGIGASDERLWCTICQNQAKTKVSKGRTLGQKKK